MVEERIRGRMCHEIHRYAKANNKYMKNCEKNEESLFLESCKKFVRKVSKIDEDFI